MNNLGHFDDFAEEHLDYARCQRADGSYYGTSGVCRTGSAAGAKEFNKRMDKLAARMDKVDPQKKNQTKNLGDGGKKEKFANPQKVKRAANAAAKKDPKIVAAAQKVKDLNEQIARERKGLTNIRRNGGDVARQQARIDRLRDRSERAQRTLNTKMDRLRQKIAKDMKP